MAKIEMTLTNTDWTKADFAEVLVSDSKESPAVAAEVAEMYAAWWILNLSARMTGWSWADGTFTGPARDDAYAMIRSLDSEATDWALEHLAEIKADAAKQPAA